MVAIVELCLISNDLKWFTRILKLNSIGVSFSKIHTVLTKHYYLLFDKTFADVGFLSKQNVCVIHKQIVYLLKHVYAAEIIFQQMMV